MAINRHLLHVKSNQTVTTTVDNESVTRAKLPSPTNIEHGEIAINYHDGYETISIKNDNNEIVEFPNLNVVNTLINDGDKIKSLTTYEASTPLAVGDTHDQALSKLSKIIDDNETVVARALTELEDTKADKDDLYTKDEVDSLIEETNDSLTQIIEDNELTIATALNDLDSRISNMKGSIEELNEPSESTPLAVGDSYDDAFAKLTKIIRDDEEITARALTDLNETKQDEITDLDTIRSGAARGATALQSETQLSKGTSTGDGNVVTDIAVNNHQITLTMGLTALTENALKTVNSLSLVGNGNIDAEDVILGKLVEGSGALAVKNFYRFNGTYTQKPTDIVPSPDFSDTAETPNDKKIYVDILTQKIYWYTSNSGMPAGQRFKELCEVDLSSYADGAEYDSTEKKIYLKHGATRLSNPIDATDFIKDGMVNSVRIDTLDDGSSDDGSDGYEAKYLIITFNTDAGMEDIEIPLSDIFDPSLYYTKEEIDEHELVTAAALTELHDTKQDLLSFDSTPTANSTNPVTSGGIKTSLDSKQDALTFDSTPTANSTNPVTSGGIKTALDEKQDKMLIVTATVTGGDGTTYYTATLDKTHSEIVAAMQANKNVYIYIPAMFGGAYVQMTQITVSNTNAFFVVISNELWYCHTSMSDSDNSCTIYKFDYLKGGDIQDFITSVWYDTTNKIVKRQDYAGNVNNVLTFDSTPTANSTNPVTSGGIKEYVDAGDKIKSLTTYEASTPLAVGDTHDQALSKLTKIIRDNELATAGALTELHDTKQDLLTFDDEPTANSENPVTSDGIYTALDSKQDALTFDSTPTANSTNPVTSSGIKSYLDLHSLPWGEIDGYEVSSTNSEGVKTLDFTSSAIVLHNTESLANCKIIIVSQRLELQSGYANNVFIASDGSWAAQNNENVVINYWQSKNEILRCHIIVTLPSGIGETPTSTETWTLTSKETMATEDYVDNALSNVNTDHLTEVTYSELKTLRDDSELVPGMFYRITDYQCTTTQDNTKSAGHQFDIVLLALSENKLAEEGWAMMHNTPIYDVILDDGTYKCYYITVLNGTVPKFIKVDDTRYAIDEATLAEITIDEATKTITFDEGWSEEDFVYSENGYAYNYFQNSNLSAWKVWYCLDNNKVKYSWADTTNGKGVIYRLIDEWGNDCPYDFKNIQFKRPLDSYANYSTNGTDTWVYTFNAYIVDTYSDNSLGFNLSTIGGSGMVTLCHHNIIKPCSNINNYQNIIAGTAGEFVLNDTVFLNRCHSLNNPTSLILLVVERNVFDVNSHNNTLSMITNNVFGMNFNNNVLYGVGGSFSYNSFGHNCNNCKFYDMSDSVIGNDVNHVNFATDLIDGYVVHCTIEDGVEYVTVSNGTGAQLSLRDITILRGVRGTSGSQKILSITSNMVDNGSTTPIVYQPSNCNIVSV